LKDATSASVLRIPGCQRVILILLNPEGIEKTSINFTSNLAIEVPPKALNLCPIILAL
jgi:hypothetical protein